MIETTAMFKRTFVLFFCIGQILASALFSGQAEASCRSSICIKRLTSFTVISPCEEEDILEVDESICLHPTFFEAHEFEWKENLSELLNHRTTSYRFISYESVPSDYFHFSAKSFIQHYTRQLIGSVQGLGTLPDYYNFLHRLCPF